jgi:hypothetical protein
VLGRDRLRWRRLRSAHRDVQRLSMLSITRILCKIAVTHKAKQCAVTRSVVLVGASPTRQLSLQPVAIGVVVEATRRQSLRWKGSLSDSASLQAVTSVNAIEASKIVMREPTLLLWGEGRRHDRSSAASSGNGPSDQGIVVPPGYRRWHASNGSTDNTGNPRQRQCGQPDSREG